METESEFATLILSFNDPIEKVAKITFNRPESLNAMNSTLIMELDRAMDVIEQKERNEVRALVVTGQGKAFMAGADIAEMSKMSPPEARHFLQTAQQVLNRLEKLPMPVIAAINGYALGGGLEVALACDIRIASEKAQVGLPEVTLGLIPSAGGTQRLTKLVGIGNAKYLIMTAKRLKAKKAKKYGIVNKVVDEEELDEKLEKMLVQITKLAPLALKSAKRAVEVGLSETLSSGLEIELDEAVSCFQSKDLREGMNAFLEKREPNFTGE